MEKIMNARVEYVNPEMAKQYMQCNVNNNRRIRPKTVNKYARDMKNGVFALTHQGIAFDKSGNLIDGQHRLLAILLSGKPMWCLVTRNVDESAMAYIDRGTSRSVHDSLTVAHPGNTDVDKVLRNNAVPAVLRQMVVCSLKEMSLSVSEITKVFNAFETEMLELFSLNSAKHNGANRCQLLSAAIAAMHNGVTADQIDKFFRVFRKADITECSGYNVNAAIDWRRQIDEAKYRGNRMPGDKVFLGTQNAIYHFVNNTDVKRVSIPKNARYDVVDVLSGIFTAE